jgi:DNA-binding response OmpR family regulator
MKTILLVEDAAELAQVIDRELTASGYKVIHAEDGWKALTLFEKYTPDLIILDWILPGLDGLEVLRRVRSISAITVLMLTARDAEADRVLGLEIGADDYLVKPFSMRELLARTRALFRRTEMIQQTLLADRIANSPPIQQGGLYIDAEAYKVTLDGQQIELSQTEFTLLNLLVRNAGRAFSRDYLLDTVWGQDYLEGDRAVDNAILRLRKKLGAMGAAIETVWGVGYRWHDLT